MKTKNSILPKNFFGRSFVKTGENTYRMKYDPLFMSRFMYNELGLINKRLVKVLGWARAFGEFDLEELLDISECIDGLRYFYRGVLLEPMKEREKSQSKRQASRREITVTREMVIAALDALRDKRMRDGGSNTRWKSQVAKDCGLENYKSLKRKLADMDISEEWIKSYLSEGG